MTGRRKIDLVVAAGHVLTMDADQPEFVRGSVAIEAGRIVADRRSRDIAASFERRRRWTPRVARSFPGRGRLCACGAWPHPRADAPGVGMARVDLLDRPRPAWWRAEAELAALERLKSGVTTGCPSSEPPGEDRRYRVREEENACAYEVRTYPSWLAAGPPDPLSASRGAFSGRLWRNGEWIDQNFTAADARANTLALIDRWHGAAAGRISVALASPYLFGRHVVHRRTPNRLPSADDAPAILAHARDMRDIADDRKVLIQTHMFRGSVDYALRNFGKAEVERLLGDGDVLVCHANGMGGSEAEMLGAHRCGIGTVVHA